MMPIHKMFTQKDEENNIVWVPRKLFTQGGPGSGFKGHSGRLGKVGGSSSGSIIQGEVTESDISSWSKGDAKDRARVLLSEQGRFFETKNSYNNKIHIIRDNDNRLIGVLHTVKKVENGRASLSISNLIVNPEYQDKGVGRKLFEYAKGEAGDLPLVTVSLGYDSDRFYKKMGMQVYGENISGQKKFILNQQLFLSGGKGSGNYDHSGRPGFVGGSSKGGGGSAVQDDLDRLSTPQQVDHRKRVEDVVKKLGFPLDRVVSTEDEGYLFNVGDQQFRAGGDYDPKTGRINIYNIDEKSDMTMEGILSHEIMHDKWRIFRTEYQRQFIEVERSVRATDDVSKWLMRADGSLRNPADSERLWAYDMNEKFLTGDFRNTLGELDGITPYSDAYWKKALETGSGYDFELAVNETLAEIARLESNLSGTGIGVDEMQSVDPVWKSFYKKVKRGGMKQNRKLFIQTFEGHEGRLGKVGGSLPKDGIGGLTPTDWDEGRSVHPLPTVSKETKQKAVSYLDRLSESGRDVLDVGKQMNVPISKLRTGQTSLKNETLEYFMKGGKAGSLEPDIIVLKNGPEYYLRNGNHRVAASMLSGEDVVAVRLIDITGYKAQQNLFHFGGRGSGNYGHEGRPGMVGGSGKSSHPNEDYAYHGTDRSNMADIQKHGLRPNEYGNPLNFHELLSSSEYYAGENGYVMRVLRANIKDAKFDPMTRRAWTQSIVPPEDIEVKTNKGWIPLLKLGYHE